MQAFIFAILLQAHGLQAEHVSARTLPVTAPTSVIVSRGYYEKKASGWEEGHRNEIERGMYDAKGRLIGIVEVGLLDSLYKFRNAEDVAGRVTETTITTGASFYGREAVTLNAAGRVEKIEYYDDDQRLEARVELFYSAHNRVSRRDEYERKKSVRGLTLVRQVTYAYSKDGNQVRETTFLTQPKKRILKLVVADNNGNPLSETTYDQWGKADKEFEYQYEFSPAGIWTKQLKLKKLKGEAAVPVDALYRKIVAIPQP